MKQTQFYGAVAVFVLLIFLVFVLPGIHARMTAILKPPCAPAPVLAIKSPPEAEDAAGLSIDKAKAELGEKPGIGSDTAGDGPSTLAQVYAKYPDATVGNNIVASWARKRPEDKERVYAELDKEIVQAQDALKADPKDGDAKHRLFIASTLKKLCKNNFDYNFLEDVPEDEGGLLKKSGKTVRP